ncbi:zinc-binding protein A33-like [Morone saxatilis]|uniref:zinc-binding protein A33-like n=1 Tax=Morone saxatilis TaxID=34816 RepID=UPI0015E2362C|nr:zinc-binding protein A33-like [Morone saxatilis]
MASKSEMHLKCTVCHDIFKNPVVLTCSHSFCKDCLKIWWQAKESRQCPICRAESSMAEPACNLVLKNLCVAFLLEREEKASGSEDICPLHDLKYEFECQDDDMPMCIACTDLDEHTYHSYISINFNLMVRCKLEEALEPLKEKLKKYEEEKEKFDEAETFIEGQAKHTEAEIKEQFKKLHQFLKEEEEARLAALKEEEQEKNRVIRKRIEVLSKEIVTLTDTISAAEDELEGDDLSVMQNRKEVVEVVLKRPMVNVSEFPSGALIDEAKHLGNLTFNIWNKMKDMVSYTPVILDPNTAFSEFIVNDDLTGLVPVADQYLPDNPERFNGCVAALGSEGFNSGTHTWDVDVQGNADWRLGVFPENAPRKGPIEAGVVSLWHYKGKYLSSAPPSASTTVRVKKKLKKVRVTVDWDRGRVSFCDAETKTHIHTFKRIFTERMFPFFNSEHALSIIPLKISVTTEQNS